MRSVTKPYDLKKFATVHWDPGQTHDNNIASSSHVRLARSRDVKQYRDFYVLTHDTDHDTAVQVFARGSAENTRANRNSVASPVSS